MICHQYLTSEEAADSWHQDIPCYVDGVNIWYGLQLVTTFLYLMYDLQFSYWILNTQGST